MTCAAVLQIEYGGQCHISNRPYTVFRWRPGNDARYKKTIICQEVAKAKNVCQVGSACTVRGANGQDMLKKSATPSAVCLLRIRPVDLQPPGLGFAALQPCRSAC